VGGRGEAALTRPRRTRMRPCRLLKPFTLTSKRPLRTSSLALGFRSQRYPTPSHPWRSWQSSSKVLRRPSFRYKTLLHLSVESHVRASLQATAFLKESGGKLSNESRDFIQGFSLPGEAEKAAKILSSFLGEQSVCVVVSRRPLTSDCSGSRPTSICAQRHTQGSPSTCPRQAHHPQS
jgi:hypothetical protein